MSTGRRRLFEPAVVRLIGAGLLLEAALVVFWALSGAWRGSTWLIPSFFIPTLVFFGIVLCIIRNPRTRSHSRMTRAIILAFTALYLLTMLLTTKPLSNDIYRYYWDGHLLANGINPYLLPPAAPELEGWRDANWVLIFNGDISTGYPPLAEFLFASTYLTFHNIWVLRVLAGLACLATTAALMAALRASGLDERRAILFGWSPLVAVESGNSAHLDAFAILFLALAFLMTLQKRERLTAVFLALGGLAKLYPALLAPLWGQKWKRSTWLIFIATFLLPWLPFFQGAPPVSGLGVFAERGIFNASFYDAIEWSWYQFLQSSYARIPARATIALAMAILYLALVWRAQHSPNPAAHWRGAGILMGAGLLLSPVVHPWYICWMLAFGCLEFQPAWLILSGTVIFARYIYIGYEATGTLVESEWTRWAVYVPFYAVLALTELKARFRRADPLKLSRRFSDV